MAMQLSFFHQAMGAPAWEHPMLQICCTETAVVPAKLPGPCGGDPGGSGDCWIADLKMSMLPQPPVKSWIAPLLRSDEGRSEVVFSPPASFNG